ncbi:7544_t:CDS:2 [Entrophospora sp. SA101]|nr:17047_t:CDS:2 [Entrophospora sp. SA101]CAJ0908778.1 7544_t:CDS:2 [Entrophospora sp. SA101]
MENKFILLLILSIVIFNNFAATRADSGWKRDGLYSDSMPVIPRLDERITVANSSYFLVKRQNTCADPGYNPCPDGDGCCPAGSTCLPNQKCSGGCGPTYPRCSATSCCAPGQICCPLGGCCPENQICTSNKTCRKADPNTTAVNAPATTGLAAPTTSIDAPTVSTTTPSAKAPPKSPSPKLTDAAATTNPGTSPTTTNDSSTNKFPGINSSSNSFFGSFISSTWVIISISTILIYLNLS